MEKGGGDGDGTGCSEVKTQWSLGSEKFVLLDLLGASSPCYLLVRNVAYSPHSSTSIHSPHYCHPIIDGRQRKRHWPAVRSRLGRIILKTCCRPDHRVAGYCPCRERQKTNRRLPAAGRTSFSDTSMCLMADYEAHPYAAYSTFCSPDPCLLSRHIYFIEDWVALSNSWVCFIS